MMIRWLLPNASSNNILLFIFFKIKIQQLFYIHNKHIYIYYDYDNKKKNDTTQNTKRWVLTDNKKVDLTPNDTSTRYK